MIVPSRCVHLFSGNSNTTVFAYHTMESLLLHLWSMYNMCGTSNLPDSALVHACDLVGPRGIADSYKLQFELSLAMWRVRTGMRLSAVLGRWCGWSGYVCRCVTALLVLICLVCS